MDELPEQVPKRLSLNCHHSDTDSPEQSTRFDALTREGEDIEALTTPKYSWKLLYGW